MERAVARPEQIENDRLVRFKVAARAHAQAPLLAIAIQEHHIGRQGRTTLNPERLARAHGNMLWIQADRPLHEGKGGSHEGRTARK